MAELRRAPRRCRRGSRSPTCATLEPEAPPPAAGGAAAAPAPRAARRRRAPRAPAASRGRGGGRVGGRARRVAADGRAVAPQRQRRRRPARERRRRRAERGQRRPRRSRRVGADASGGRRRRRRRRRPARREPFDWPASTRVSYVLTGNYRGEVSGTRAGRVDPRRRPLPGQPRPRRRPGVRADRRAPHDAAKATLAAERPGAEPLRRGHAGRVARPAPRQRRLRARRASCSPTASGASACPACRTRRASSSSSPTCSRPSPSCCASAARSSCRWRCRATWTRWVYDVVERRDAADAVRPARGLSPEAAAACRRRPNELTAEIWFAPELRYLPVRIRIEQDAADLRRPDDRAQARDGRADGADASAIVAHRRTSRAAMTYECILTDVRGDGARRTGLITLNRPKQLNALNDTLMDELGAALLAFDADDGDRLHRRHRQRQGVRRRRRHRRDGAATASSTPTRTGFISRNWETMRAGQEAGDRRGRRLRARRRLRAGDDVRHRHRRRHREVRPARDQARHHPRRRRHAAPAARDRQGEGDGHGADRRA